MKSRGWSTMHQGKLSSKDKMSLTLPIMHQGKLNIQ